MTKITIVKLDDHPYIGEIETIHKKGEQKVLAHLRRACDDVRPIMAKRNWKLHQVGEFIPDRRELRGKNYRYQRKIQIRVRRVDNEKTVYPYERVLKILLHELVHLEVSAHDKEFYKLLREITDECERLICGKEDLDLSLIRSRQFRQHQEQELPYWLQVTDSCQTNEPEHGHEHTYSNVLDDYKNYQGIDEELDEILAQARRTPFNWLRRLYYRFFS